jgi:predicted Rossmann-fold nucleotide-binding protein
MTTIIEQHNIASVCIYAASSNKIDKKFFDAAYDLGKSLAVHGINIRYGGGNTGML